ncbi:response regulator [Paenibacillus validus]|uniref:response regulator n=1 Tax=Paenibacillus TaxID=44249 RepID=UPI000FDB5A8A|nr:MULTISPECIES: response regulator [Paenibacillus]MED4599815.1 response regulator [Paenibacillus validus]MED4604655.1 response regulator [Paenibacillus validus]
MKVIVVEDEPNSLMGMRRAVESMGMNLSLFTSNHAEEAMGIIAEHRPDLIVTDIMLPGMTGLDLVEHFVGKHYQPKIIVVSGYNDFEYAQRSIRVGAADYLLKPFHTEEFAEKIRKFLLLIQQEKEQNHHLQQQYTFAQMGNRLMRDNYLADFCLKYTPLEEHIYQRLKLWNLAWLADQPYSIMVMDTKGYPDGKPIGSNYALQTFAIGNILNEVLMDYAATVFFKDSKHRWVVITGNDKVQELIHSIIHSVKSYQKIELAIGISAKMELFEHIHSAYQDALKAFRIHSLSDHSEFFYESNPSKSSGYVTPDQMASLLCEQNEEAIARAVKQFIRGTVMLEGTESKEDVTRGVLNYLSQIHISLSERTAKELEEIPMRVWEMLDECSTIQEYQQVLRDYLTNLGRQLFAPRMNAIVERALEKMAAAYMEDITLGKVADELSIHPVWLSQVFKKETGQTFTDYLADLRINRAKTLLRETSMKIYEIATAVGYNDLQYFGTLFKKKTGETPKEFRYGK